MRDFKKQHEAFRKEKQAGTQTKILDAFGAPANVEHRSLFEEMTIMTELSALVYTVAYLLDIVGKGGYETNPNRWWWSKPERQQLEKISLVLAEESPIEEAKLQRNLPAKNVIEFINANEEHLSKDPEITGDAAEEDGIHPRTLLTISALDDIEKNADGNYLWCFDHHFGGTGIVYGVTVNRAFKRVTVVFRGSVTGEDWWQNVQMTMTDLRTPDLLQELGFEEEIKVHGGFLRYLLDDDIAKLELTEEQAKEQKPGKYGQILRDLEDCYNHEENGVKVHEGFNLYVAGHSLGGALSSLLAMKLASSWYLKEKIKAPKPIINISVASPYIGNQAFHNAVKRLEKENWLRHIRISNQNDVVPVAPPKRLFWGAIYEPYVHTGLNVHLVEGKGEHDIGYGLERTFASQFSLSSGDRHTLGDHWERMNDDVDAFKGKSIADLYEDHFPK